MNYTEITKMMDNIMKDFKGMGRQETKMDMDIKNAIITFYINVPEIDWEEVKYLWITYLEKGNLMLSNALKMARKRRALRKCN